MKKIILYTLLSVSFFLFLKCKDEITEPATESGGKYKVEGVVSFDNIPLISIEVLLDTMKCITDSSGYFSFEGLSSQAARLSINSPLYAQIDTILSINKNHYLNLNLAFKSNSFFPLSIGNRWYYNNLMSQIPDSSKHELIVEVIEKELIGGKYFFKLMNLTFSNDLVDTSRSYTYLLLEGDSLLEYNCGQIGLLADFSIAENDTFIYQRCGNSYFGVLTESKGNILSYSYNPQGLVLDGWFGNKFQKGIGITCTQTAWDYYVLDKYEIQ